MSWTDERIAKLTKMWEGGATASQIADDLGGVSTRKRRKIKRSLGDFEAERPQLIGAILPCRVIRRGTDWARLGGDPFEVCQRATGCKSAALIKPATSARSAG